ncbi:MAG TPA: caspase family protein [Gemmataceae bacterium]|nr:caspase family protein [Gemmataceae bacterium]
MDTSRFPSLAGLIAVSLLALLPVARAEDPDPPGPRELKTLRALLVLDTNSNLAASIEHDRKNMKVLLEEYVPAERRRIDYLEGAKVTREQVLKYYRDLKAGPDEALLFFYAGHGAIDANGAHVFQPQMGKTPALTRGEVRKAMEQKGAGLVLLLTDCCSTRIRGWPKAKTREPRTKVEMHPVLRCLFFQHRGTVDVTAAEDGMGSYGDEHHGGVFTSALVTLLEGDLKPLDTNRDKFVSWKEFFPLLSRETEREFKGFAARARANNELVEQSTQRPRYFTLAEPAAKGPDADASKTYAVVSLRNDSGKPVRYRYRWSGEKEWKEGTIPEQGRVVHELAVAEGAKVPDFEIEAGANSESGKATLKPAKWTGKGRPSYKDGQKYDITLK